MTEAQETVQQLHRQCQGALIIVKKNALLYYLKPPVLIFGVMFPIFFFLAFKMGRPIAAENIMPGMVAMALWFTASAVGPLVTPWERRAKTYERLISSPVSLSAILTGDVISGLVFGACLSIVPILLGFLVTNAVITSIPLLIIAILLSGLCFASLGVLLAAPPASSPSNIMLLSNLVRLPLLFVSGIFLPVGKMPLWARWIAPISPLSYANGAIRSAFGQQTYFAPGLSLAMLLLFAIIFFLASVRFHNLWRAKGL